MFTPDNDTIFRLYGFLTSKDTKFADQNLSMHEILVDTGAVRDPNESPFTFKQGYARLSSDYRYMLDEPPVNNESLPILEKALPCFSVDVNELRSLTSTITLSNRVKALNDRGPLYGMRFLFNHVATNESPSIEGSISLYMVIQDTKNDQVYTVSHPSIKYSEGDTWFKDLQFHIIDLPVTDILHAISENIYKESYQIGTKNSQEAAFNSIIQQAPEYINTIIYNNLSLLGTFERSLLIAGMQSANYDNVFLPRNNTDYTNFDTIGDISGKITVLGNGNLKELLHDFSFSIEVINKVQQVKVFIINVLAKSLGTGQCIDPGVPPIVIASEVDGNDDIKLIEINAQGAAQDIIVTASLFAMRQHHQTGDTLIEMRDSPASKLQVR